MSSYATVAQADQYITEYYVSTSPEKARWDSLSEADKGIYLRKATDQIDLLPFLGDPVLVDQQNSFPRYIEGQLIETPVGVVNGTIETALSISDQSQQEEQSQRLALQRQGVSSFTIGKLSETYSGKIFNTLPFDLPSARVWLSPWLRGGYRIV